MSDNVCRWHGCNGRIDHKNEGCTVQPRGYQYHWACIRDLVNYGEIALYCDDIGCEARERSEMIKYADMANMKIAQLRRKTRR
jgi:hypothetical protein